MRPLVAFVLFIPALLSGCVPALTGKHSVTELKCDQTALDENGKCPKIPRIGADLEIIVNPQAQKVQIIVERTDGNWWVKTLYLENCYVTDVSNWRCKQPGVMNDTYEMLKGHFFHELSSATPPNYYTSSVSGWRRTALKLGLMSSVQAQSFD